MSNNYRVLNLTTGERTKYKQALKRIEECLWAWVEIGKTVRTLSLQEQFRAKAKQNELRDPLPGKEVPNVIERMPASRTWNSEAKLGASLEAIYLAGSERQKKRLSVPLSQLSNQYAQEATA